jgi:hypothetical protein
MLAAARARLAPSASAADLEAFSKAYAFLTEAPSACVGAGPGGPGWARAGPSGAGEAGGAPGAGGAEEGGGLATPMDLLLARVGAGCVVAEAFDELRAQVGPCRPPLPSAPPPPAATPRLPGSGQLLRGTGAGGVPVPGLYIYIYISCCISWPDLPPLSASLSAPLSAPPPTPATQIHPPCFPPAPPPPLLTSRPPSQSRSRAWTSPRRLCLWTWPREGPAGGSSSPARTRTCSPCG